MPVKDITPELAHELLTSNPHAVYIDVRTEREFANGHPQGAVNIPVAFPDPARGRVAIMSGGDVALELARHAAEGCAQHWDEC